MSVPSIPELFVAHWQAAWTLDAQAALYVALYLCATTRLNTRWPARRTSSFLAGTACVVIALQSGLDRYSDRLLSVHMVQHLLLLLLAPLLLLGGRPAILLVRAMPHASRARAARLLSRVSGITTPVVCVALFSAVVVATHIPSFYAETLRHPVIHALEHLAYLVVGLLLWWPLLDADPAPSRRLGGLGRLVYVLAAMPSMALVGAYLNRHADVVYQGYIAPAHALGVSAVANQQQAGAIMWVAGGAVMVIVGLWTTTAALVAEERRQRALDLRSAGLTAEPDGAGGALG